MADLLGKRTLTIGGYEQIYDSIEDLADDVEHHLTQLRRMSLELTDDTAEKTLDQISKRAQAQLDRIDAHEAWAAEILASKQAAVEKLREALSNLPSPFQEGGPA